MIGRELEKAESVQSQEHSKQCVVKKGQTTVHLFVNPIDRLQVTVRSGWPQSLAVLEANVDSPVIYWSWIVEEDCTLVQKTVVHEIRGVNAADHWRLIDKRDATDSLLELH